MTLLRAAFANRTLARVLCAWAASSLIRDTPRTATVRAAAAVHLVVDRADFLDSIGAHPRCTHAAHTVAEARMATAVEAAGG